jgi:hypothetical protein
MRQKERAWCVAGHRIEVVAGLASPQVWSAAGQPAVLFLPPGYDADTRELAVGWAMADLAEQRCGWLFLVRRLIHFASAVGRVAVASGLTWPALRLLLVGVL